MKKEKTVKQAKTKKPTYCVAIFHLAKENGNEAVVEDSSTRIISIDENNNEMIIESNKYAIDPEAIKNVVIGLIRGNNSRLQFSCEVINAIRIKGGCKYILSIPQEQSAELPNGETITYKCYSLEKLIGIGKSKNDIGRKATKAWQDANSKETA